jgi:hypothetical protein
MVSLVIWKGASPRQFALLAAGIGSLIAILGAGVLWAAPGLADRSLADALGIGALVLGAVILVPAVWVLRRHRGAAGTADAPESR